VVATAVGGTPEVVADGESGFLVTPGDAHALAERTARLLADASLRRTMGAAGRALVSEQFTFRAQAAKYEELFSSISE
jgi:glycosyltransferase involved in cell wall biosynthesis